MTNEILVGEDVPAAAGKVQSEGSLEDEGTLDGASVGDLPPEAEVEYSVAGLPILITLPLLVPEQAILKFKREGKVVREEPYPKLVFSRLNGGDMEAIMAASQSSMMAVMCQRSCKMPGMNPAKFNVLWRQMDGADQVRAARCVDHFLSNGRKTGRS